MAQGLYLVHLSIHGLIRGNDLELGRDADTGGQCKYVVELVKALGKHSSVEKVDLLTRQVIDPKVSSDYAKSHEPLGNGVSIRRIIAGPKRYFRKESLWRYMDAFIDQSLALFRETGRLPDLIHAHYADAGYVGSRLASLLGCPFVFTGHSLGRTKLARLEMQKKERGVIEKRYNLSARIEAEELSLDTASFVCTSTQQEVDEQYALYDFYDPDRMSVIPPGVDVSRFAPPGEGEVSDAIQQKIDRFLDDPSKPIILAIARADEKKNLSTLIKAYGASQQLQDKANLVIFAGNRDRISELNPGARKVWTELLQLIDDFDLYGKISIPKHHEPDEIPEVYRYAASKRGLFVNPAFIEPFGLTLIEAAASGLPMLATNDGGPRDIISNCQNGMLIDPESVIGLTNALEQGFANEDQWSEWVSNGLEGIDQHYTWEKHVETYLNRAADLISEITQPQLITNKRRSSLPLKTRMIFTGLEDRLQPEDQESISQLREIVECGQPQLGLGIVTGRSLDMVRDLIEELNFPAPDVVVTDLGGGIYYGSREIPDLAWESHLRHMWEPGNICALLEEIPGVTLQEEPGRQQQFKISYDYEKGVAPPRREIQRHLRENSVSAKVILSEGKFLDVIPLRSGKGNAIRYLTMRWGIPADRVLVHARRGSDYEALSGQFLAVLSADHSLELRKSVSLPRVFLSERPNYGGLLEGIFSYGFDDRIMVPDAADDLEQHDVSEPEAVLSPDMVAHLNEGE